MKPEILNTALKGILELEKPIHHDNSHYLVDDARGIYNFYFSLLIMSNQKRASYDKENRWNKEKVVPQSYFISNESPIVRKGNTFKLANTIK